MAGELRRKSPSCWSGNAWTSPVCRKSPRAQQQDADPTDEHPHINTSWPQRFKALVTPTQADGGEGARCR